MVHSHDQNSTSVGVATSETGIPKFSWPILVHRMFPPLISTACRPSLRSKKIIWVMVSQHAKLAIFEKDSILPYGSGLFHYRHIFNRKALG